MSGSISKFIKVISRSLLGGLLLLGSGEISLAGDASIAEPLRYPDCLDARQFDRQIQSQVSPPTRDRGSDDRLLIVGITETDIRALKQWPFSDQTYADFLAALQRHQPTVIGLALYQDLPVSPGVAAFNQQLQRSNVILAGLLDANYNSYEIAPRSDIPADRIGFLNIPRDRDGVVRRSLIFVPGPTNKISTSFSWRLATHYLEQQNVFPQLGGPNTNILKLGRSIMPPLRRDCSETAPKLTGYQIPLYYRTPGPIARQVTFTQVLNHQIDPDWIKGKVVLVGLTAPTFKDVVNTPYLDPDRAGNQLQLYGVELQAQMVSQLLTAALGVE